MHQPSSAPHEDAQLDPAAFAPLPTVDPAVRRFAAAMLTQAIEDATGYLSDYERHYQRCAPIPADALRWIFVPYPARWCCADVAEILGFDIGFVRRELLRRERVATRLQWLTQRKFRNPEFASAMMVVWQATTT